MRYKNIINILLCSLVVLILILLILYTVYNYVFQNKIMRLNKKYIIKNKYNSVIPLNIFTTWHSKNIPEKMIKSIRSVRLNNPEFNFYIFDDKECLSFIKKYFDKDVVLAYNKLIPAAYKSDLWRYCVLYIYGGIYYDIKFRCVNNFKFIALTEKENWIQDTNPNNVCNGLLCCKPRNEILLKCIKKIVYHSKINYYGNSSLDPTGPSLLGKFFNKNEKDNMQYCYKIFYNIPSYLAIICRKTNTIVMEPYQSYRKEQSKTHYGVLWKKRKIYNQM